MYSVLKNRHSHPRDNLIKFYNSGHKYEISTDKKTKYTSVTTWAHSHFPKFDADVVIANIFNGKNWGPGHKYWGMTAEQIKNSWKSTGTAAAGQGTSLHDRIERFMNDRRFTFAYTQKELCEIYKTDFKDKVDDQIEWEYFINFVSDHPDLKPYRTEWSIYDEDLKLAGSIDMVYENPDGTLAIYDWKRCKDIPKENSWNKFATNPLVGHLYDEKFWHYTLQLNTYRAIIERKYGKVVSKLCLVKLHPESANKNYEMLEVPMLDKEIDDLFTERLEQVKVN
jgi:hypothetical protein